MVSFDWTVTFGNVLEIAAMLVGFIAAYYNLKLKIASLEFKVNLLWESKFPGIKNVEA